MPLKILVATNMYPVPEYPYLGAFVFEQVASLRRLGLEVDVAAQIGKTSRWHYVSGLFEMIGMLRRKRYDLIHSHHSYSTIIAHLARRIIFQNIPIIETFHESEIYRRATEFNEDRLRQLRNSHRIKAWALRRVEYAILDERHMVETVMGAQEAARLPALAMPAGIDMKEFSPAEKGPIRRRLGWTEDGLYIFFPCDPGKPEKRYDLAQGGFDLFARERPGAKLIIGGAIPHDQMPDHLKAADVILVPTDFEAAPTVVREALACERPVVSTDVGDVKENYGDLPEMFMCDWTAADVADKLRRAVEFEGPYEGRKRIFVLELELDQVARRIVKIYEEVLGIGK